MEYLISTRSIGGMTEDQFFRFCQENHSLRLERNAAGDIILMEPTGTRTGWYNINIATELTNWNRHTGLGLVFDSNTGFTLPNEAVRSPDAAFIRKDRWQKVSPDDQLKFAHICPDFVIELLSESDSPLSVKEKMKEWIKNGCRLAWMIDSKKKETTIYRGNGETEVRPFDDTLNGEDVLPDFELNLNRILSDI